MAKLTECPSCNATICPSCNDLVCPYCGAILEEDKEKLSEAAKRETSNMLSDKKLYIPNI